MFKTSIKFTVFGVAILQLACSSGDVNEPRNNDTILLKTDTIKPILDEIVKNDSADIISETKTLNLWRIEQNQIQTLVYYDSELKWVGYKYDYQFLFPLKGHHLLVDSAYIMIPYENGKTWYEGQFVRYSKTHHKYLGKGIHKIYNMDGSKKGEVDYSKRTVKKYLNPKKYDTFTFEEYQKIEYHMTKWSKVDSLHLQATQ